MLPHPALSARDAGACRGALCVLRGRVPANECSVSPGGNQFLHKQRGARLPGDQLGEHPGQQLLSPQGMGAAGVLLWNLRHTASPPGPLGNREAPAERHRLNQDYSSEQAPKRASGRERQRTETDRESSRDNKKALPGSKPHILESKDWLSR